MSTETLEGKEEPITVEGGEEENKGRSAQWWRKQLALADEESAEFRKQAQKAWDEYTFSEARKDHFQKKVAANQHFPMFWANVNILSPNIYNFAPDPIVKRRYNDEDPISRLASFIGERLAAYLIDESPYHKVLKRATLDMLVSGRGNIKVCYERKEGKPSKSYLQMDQIPPELAGQVQQDEIGTFILEPDPAPESESVIPQLISKSEFRCTPGVTCWSDVWWKAYDTYMDVEDFKARFGPQVEKLGYKISQLPFNYDSKRAKKDENEGSSQDNAGDYGKFCKVVEIWDKRKSTTLWLVEDWDGPVLEEAQDLYELRKFFASPDPAQVSGEEDSIHPIPDFVQYQQSLSVIDFLENRKWRIIKALRPHGIYDASQKELGRLRSEAEDADLIPVKNMTELSEKGGLDAVIQYADKSSLIQALQQTYESIEQEKQKIYEITGTSDIVRGASQASESATAQSIKNDSFNTRLNDRREAIAGLARDVLEIMLELALSVFHDNTIAMICGAEFLSEEDQQDYPIALSLLRHDKFRTFKLEIETSSTWASQDMRDKEQSNELIQTLSGLYEQVVNISQAAPELLPSMKEAAMYAVRRLHQATSIESSIEKGFDQLEARIMEMLAPPDPNAPPPPPDPAVELENMKMQGEQMKFEQSMQLAQVKGEAEFTKLQAQSQAEQRRAEIEAMKLDKEIAKLQAQMQLEQQQAATGAAKTQGDLMIQGMKQQIEQIKAEVAQFQAITDLTRKASEEIKAKVASVGEGKSSQQPVTIVIQDKGKRVAKFIDTPTGRMAVSEPLEETTDGGTVA